ncbi:MAG: nicotinate-nucleotide adenylyltransferase [Eubacteriales bacterium]
MRNLQKHGIGVMGGTFDPIHYGHLYIAESSRCRFNLGKILFMPSGNPVHKKRNDITDHVHRLEMTRLAIAKNPYFALSTLEVDRPGPTYTVDTLEYLKNDCSGTAGLFFITGADAILDILTWKDVPRIFELCRFIAVTRPGFSFRALNEMLADLTEEQRKKIHLHETGGIQVSSTEIRRRISRGEPVKYLLPDSVEKYIEKQGLYRHPDDSCLSLK